MDKPLKRYGVIVLVAAVTICPAARAGGVEPASRLAGPWYTPQELKALIAYANASTAQKRALLAGRAIRTRHAQDMIKRHA